MLKGLEAGGQLMLTTDVENYPGFADGILGPELMDQMEKQAARFGAEILPVHVTGVDFSLPALRRLGGRPGVARTHGRRSPPARPPAGSGCRARRSSAAEASRACATCDGFFFRDRELVVVGGGDSAMEEATFLTKFASKVTIVHRRDEFRASKIMQERALANPKIEVIWNTEVAEVLGEDAVTGVRLRDTVDRRDRESSATDGVFVAIGHTPNTELFRDWLELDDDGYIVVRGAAHAHVRRGRVRGGRCYRPDLSSGGDRGRPGMQGRDGCGDDCSRQRRTRRSERRESPSGIRACSVQA